MTREVSEPPYRVTVALPTHDIVPAAFAYDLAMMAAFTGSHAAKYGIEYRQAILYGTLIDSMREGLVSRAIEANATHVLFIDTDMRFPKDLLMRLLAREEDIVGINYSTRRQPHEPTAFARLGYSEEGPDGTRVEIPHERVWYEEGATDLVPVESMGMGGCMIATKVFKDMPRPWFKNTSGITPDGRYVSLGEDVFFCKRARQAGYQPKVDPTFDTQVGHIGTFTYTLPDATRFKPGSTSKIVSA